MSPVRTSLAQQVVEERIRQAEQRRLTRGVRPTEYPVRRVRRFVRDLLFA
jgi:hypothetical protein